MKTKALLIVAALIFIANAFSQNTTIQLTFTAVTYTTYVKLDSVKVMNRTQGGYSMIHWPDTTLSLSITPGDLLLYVGYTTAYPVGVTETNMDKEQFKVFQNYPNPGKDQSLIAMYIPENGMVNVMVSDMHGRVVAAADLQLEKGNYSFRFTPGGDNLYFLTARWNGISRSIKMLATEPAPAKKCLLEYAGTGKRESLMGGTSLKSALEMQESGILDRPVSNESYIFQFANNIPCIGTPIVDYEGQVYNTIQVFSQCWLKENLNVGTMVDSLQDQIDNGVIEKYCIGNNPDTCNKYGGLYQWWEIMQYTSQEGVRGICPPGWHLPTDEEGKVLDGAADTQYGIGDSIWDMGWYRGYDAGTNLKSTKVWNWGGIGTDRLGYEALPGGRRVEGPYYTFYTNATYGFWWTSTINSTACGAWMRYLCYEEIGAGRGTSCDGFDSGMLGRCIKDY
jgi:uncharacterized protein (TIGR02145 family)